VFKSFSKVISQATLNAQKRTYIVNHTFSIQNPALYYLNQNTPPQDLFQLSLVSYHLIRKNELGRNLIHQLEGETELPGSNLIDYRDRLLRKTDEDYRLASGYVDQIRKMLKANAGTLPVHNAIQALYAFEGTNKSDVPLYEEYLFPVIREKLAYASLNNLIELAHTLSNVKYYEDKELWNSIVQHLNEKFEKPGPKYVQYSGWDLDAYELQEKGSAHPEHRTETEKHLSQIRGGSKHIANLRHEIRTVFDWLRSGFLYRLLFKEARVSQTLDNFPEILDREKLRRGLEGARNAGINVDSVIGRLRLE